MWWQVKEGLARPVVMVGRGVRQLPSLLHL